MNWSQDCKITEGLLKLYKEFSRPTDYSNIIEGHVLDFSRDNVSGNVEIVPRIFHRFSMMPHMFVCGAF